jgi:SfnB family sulfur acquisition oxidoreductase
MDNRGTDFPMTTPGSLIAAARELSRDIALSAAQRDIERIIPIAEAKRLRQLHLQTARIASEYGGPGASFVELAEIMLHLGAGDPNLAQMVQPHFFFLDWLRLEGSTEQRAKFYGDVLKGHIITNALVERGTPTPGEIKTTLTRDGGRYRLDGTKFYTTGSMIADQFYVSAICEDGTMAYAIIPKTRVGVQIIDDWDGMGQRTTASGTTQLAQIFVEPEEIVRVPNRKKKRTYLGAAAQITHAAIDVGIALAALSDAVDFARTKARPFADSGVERAANDPYVMHMVGQMAVISHSAEAILYRSAAVLDHTASATLAIEEGDELECMLVKASIAVAEAKAAANEASLQVSEMMFNVSGASATLRKYNFDRHWRNARTHTTHDPVSYKYKAIGDFLLNDTYPPISMKI